jgi:hypothetical protein
MLIPARSLPPGPLKSIGTALLPVPNVEDHLIEGVIQAL